MRFRLFFFNDTATTEIYTLSLHDALPIWDQPERVVVGAGLDRAEDLLRLGGREDELHVLRGLLDQLEQRSEEHTSELQSRQYLVCRLLLEKKKNKTHIPDD